MRIRLDGITEPTHIEGVWRAPGEEIDLPGAQARKLMALGHARTAGPVAVHPPSQPTRRAPRLFLDGRPVGSLPRDPQALVSIVVPLFHSQEVVGDLVKSLKDADNTPCELIFVSDADGVYDVPGRQIVLGTRSGFAGAVNAGAQTASGKYLCLLNADVRVHAGWLGPMVRLIESAPDIAAAGNRNLDRLGRIDSVGSEFSYDSGNFEHALLGASDVPSPERDRVTERDMITAACLLVRRDVWEQFGGFDEAYRIGYFEDTDFCMRLREAGWRILYCPDSVVTHRKNHSGAGRHEFYTRNKRRFHRRWVETGCVDRFAKARGRRVHDGDVVACYIVLNEAEFVQASIESVYPLADRIVVVEGGNDYAVAASSCGPDKRSTDDTVERIRQIADPDGKIELIQGAWRDKAEQRNAYAARLRPGDWMLLMDGDEVFYNNGLWRLSSLMHAHEIIQPLFDLFWNNFHTVGAGRWEAFPQVKVVRWHEGYRYRDHNCPSDASGRLVGARREARALVLEPLYAHYAWVKPLDKLRAKAAYYERQPGAACHMRRNYIDEVFLRWRIDPHLVERRFGTHPFGGGGAAAFVGQHPEPVRRRLAAGEFAWE